MSVNSLLRVCDLTIGYGKGNQALPLATQLHFELKAGQLVSLIGPNGVGKSTLLRTLCGIQPALSGSVFWEDKPLVEWTAEQRARKLALVLTDKIPKSNLTVYELIALGRHPYTNWLGQLAPDDIKAIETAMEQTEVSLWRDRKHYELSDGQLQRVLIARALAQDTPWIVLDEPTTHLDLVHKVGVFQLLQRVAHQTGKCILFSTHDIDLAIQLSDEMLIMTPQQLVLDQPCNHIESGIFNTLFTDEHIRFDAEKGRFVIS